MKLRLPYKLQTAILTAFASVTFFTVGTATLGAARGEEAPEFASFTDTGFEVSEEELEVDLGEKEKTKEPDSAPANHAGFNGIYGSSDQSDLEATVEGITESTSATENVASTAQTNYAGTDSGTIGNTDFTTNPYADDVSGVLSNSSASVSLTSSAPAASVQEQPAIPAEQEDTAEDTTAGSANKIAALSAYNGPDYYGSSLGLTAPVYAPKAKLAAAGADAATRPGYSGTILTWDNVIASAPSNDLAYGYYRTTEYNQETGEFTVGDGQGGWTSPNQGLIGTNNNETRNTLRFAASEYGQSVKTPAYTFDPLALAGFIVDSGAEGFTVTSSGGGGRNFYLGNNNTTEALSSINEDFTFNKNSGTGKVYLRGTQTIDVASGKTFTLGSNNGMELTSNLNLTLAGGGKLLLRTNADVTSGNGSIVKLTEDSTLLVRADGNARSYSFDNLQVSGTGHLSVTDSTTGGQGYQAMVNVNHLSNADSSPAVLTVGNAARSTGSVINLNGGSFNGEIVLRGEVNAGTRRTAVQFKGADVASGSVVTFTKDTSTTGTDKLGMGVGADISLLGIRHAEGSSVDSAIYSGSYNAGFNSDFASQGNDVHTITFTGNDAYSTSARVSSHLNFAMNSASGSGSQTFTGNLSGMDGTVTVSNGALTLANSAGTGTLASVGVSGGTLTLTNMNVANAVTLSGGTLDLVSSTTSIGSLNMTGGTLKLAGANSLTSSGTLHFGSGATLDLANINVTDTTPITLATGSGISGALHEVTLQNLNNTPTGYEAVLDTVSNSLVLTFKKISNDLIWDGSDTAMWDTGNNWHAEGKDAGTSAFITGANVQFTAAYTTAATLGNDVTAGNMVVDNNATATVDTAGYHLTVDALSAANHATGGNLVKQGEGTLTVSGTAHMNDVTIADGTLELTQESSVNRIIADGTGVVVSGDGPITVRDDAQDHGVEIARGKSLTITAGDLTATTLYNNGSLTVGDGSSDTLVKTKYFVNGNIQDGSYNTSFEIKSNATVAISEGDNTHKTGLVLSEWVNTTTATVAGKLLAPNATLLSGNTNPFTLNIEDGGLVAVEGIKSKGSQAYAVNLNEGGTLVFGGTTSANGGGTLNAAAGSTIGISDGTTSYNAAIVLGAAEGKSVVVDTAKYVFNEDGTDIIKGTEGGNLTLSGAVSDSGSLTKEGAGTLTLSGANTYSGGTTVNGGTVKLGNKQALGTGSTITVNEGGTIDVNGTADAKYTYTLHGGTLTNTGSAIGNTSAQTTGVVLTADSTISADSGHEFRLLAGDYAATTADLGNHTLAKTGSGTVEFRNTEVTEGTLDIQGGSILFSDSNGKKGSVAADVKLNGGNVEGQMNLGDDISIITEHHNTTTGVSINTAGNTVTFDGPGDLTMSGTITGDGKLVKEGTGTLTLGSTASLDLTGITVAGGTLVTGCDGSALTGDVLVQTGGTLELTSSATALTVDLDINDGSLKFAGNNMLTTSGTLTFGNGASLDLSHIDVTSGTDPITLATATGGIVGDVNTVSITHLTPPTGYKGYLSTVGNDLVLTFKESDRNLIWQGGAGLWDKESANWYANQDLTHKVKFEDADNVTFQVKGHSEVVVKQDLLVGDIYVNDGVLVTLTEDSPTGEVLTVHADTVDVKGDLTVSDVAIYANNLKIEEGSHVTADVSGNNTSYLQATISGDGDAVKQGEGTLVLTGDNVDFDGRHVIEEGTVKAESDTSLGNAPIVVMHGGELAGDIAPEGDIHITSTADASVTAGATVENGKTITFNTEGTSTITSTGNIIGDGGIYKDGAGTLVLKGTNETTGGMDIFLGRVEATTVDTLGSGHIHVDSSATLALTDKDAHYQIDELSVGFGGTIVFAGATTDASQAMQLELGTMNLQSSSFVDFSNIELSAPTSGSTKYYLAHYDEAVWTERGSVKDGLVQFIAMTGINGLQNDNIVSLHVDQGNKLLYLQVDAPHTGYYWNSRKNNHVWDTTSGNWSTDSALSNTTTFRQSTKGNRIAAYFMQDRTETIELTGQETYELQHLVIGDGNYTFTSNKTEGHTIHFDTDALATVTVSSGAKANFDKVALSASENSLVHICKDATLNSKNAAFEMYSIDNEGTVEVEAAPSFEALLGHITNTGTFKAVWQDSMMFSTVSVGDIANGGDMTLGAAQIVANFEYGNHTINNDGTLTLDATCPSDEGDMPTGEVVLYLPVEGVGRLATTGDHTVRLSGMDSYFIYAGAIATVSQKSLDVGAANNIFEEAVQLSEYTTVQSGSEATFYGGNTIDEVEGSFGALTLNAGTSDDPTKVTLGGYYRDDYGEGIQHDSTYTAGPVVAGGNTVLTVENGAHATIDSYNAGAAPAGKIVVGAETSQFGTTYAPASLTVKGVTNADTLDVQGGTTNLDGYATVTTLTQSGGQLNLNAGGFVDNATVSGGTLDIGDGKVLTLGHVVTETGDYTVASTTGSINANALTLEKNMGNAQYHEAVSDSKTKWQSGFLEGGQQYVKVFDVQDGALISNGVTVTHKEAAGPMTLIGTGDTAHPDKAGYGYLDTSQTVYATYYVRDNYVTGDPGGRESETRTADYVKLSNVMEASKGDGTTPQLETVVFDKTDYNQNEAVSGTLTVDVQGQHADLFDVKEGAVGIVNIGTDADDERVMLCCCEEFDKVNGQMLIAGTGIYQLENRGTLGGGVSLLDETTVGITPWTGTVRITGSGTDLKMAPLAVGSGKSASEIEFFHWTGSILDATSDARILLTGVGATAEPAIDFTMGSEEVTELTWNNTVKGTNARIVNHEGGNVSLTMTGDTSGWTGVIDEGHEGTVMDVKFLLDMDNVWDTEATDAQSQYAELLTHAGTMNATYGGDLKNVNGDVLVYDTGVINLHYTGTEMQVNSNIEKFEKQGDLSITVGDGSNAASATFNGKFTNTDPVTMKVEDNSSATINTNAALLRVVGDTGSGVAVNSGKTLSLTSENPETGFSEFHGLTNDGTIQMEADGGSIHLVVDNGVTAPTYKVGDLDLVGDAGTAVIQTAANGQTVKVEITDLSGPNSADQVLQLKNSDASGTVNYNLGGDTHYTGTIEFGSNGSAGNTNVVLNSDGAAANAVLKSTGSGSGTEDVVVNTANAQVLGIDSSGNASGTLYGTDGSRKAVTVTGDGTYSYNGALGKNLDIAYTGDGKQTFEGGAANFNGKVTVNNDDAAQGILEILNASSVSITDLTIGANDKLDVGSGTATASSSVVALGGPTTNNQQSSASKLDGNLTLGSGASYDVSAAQGKGGLDLGGALTISKGATLSAGDIAKIYDMEIGEMYDLAFDVTSFNGVATASGFNDDGTTFGSPIDASTLFGDAQFWEGEYYVCFSGAGTNGGKGGNVGTVYLYKATPEPTTGTLSLLALAALAARRRRK